MLSGSNSAVEFLPSKQAVAGSNPVSRSIYLFVYLSVLKPSPYDLCFIKSVTYQLHLKPNCFEGPAREQSESQYVPLSDLELRLSCLWQPRKKTSKEP